jgi:hypothetical protein
MSIFPECLPNFTTTKNSAYEITRLDGEIIDFAKE